jgi:hypothetical protein
VEWLEAGGGAGERPRLNTWPEKAAALDAKQSRGAEQEPEEEEGERGSEGPFWNLQNLRDLTVKKIRH